MINITYLPATYLTPLPKLLKPIQESQNKGIREHKKILMKKGRNMNREVRRIVENRKGRQIGRIIESDRKRENY